MHTNIIESPQLRNVTQELPPVQLIGTHQGRSRHLEHSPVEVHAVVDRILRCFSTKGRNVFLTRMSEGDLEVNVSQAIFSRIVFCIFESVFESEAWRGPTPTSVAISSHRRDLSRGVVLEVADNGAPLPRRIMAELNDPDSPPPYFIPGWQLLKCRDLAERNGGRLLVTSPTRKRSWGAHFQLYLPLTNHAHQR